MRIDVLVKEKPSLKNPTVICGLPGAAFVGKFALDHLIEELQAKPLAEFYCAGFPSQIMVGEEGTCSAMKNEVLFWKNESGDGDILLYTGDTQPTDPESEYELAESVIDFLMKEHNVRKLVTLGAFVTGDTTVEPKVYSAATDHSIVQDMEARGCKIMMEGTITGMNGLLLGMARLKGLPGYVLLGETSGLTFDAKASEAILNVISGMVGIKVDYKKLEQRAREAQDAVRAIEAIKAEQTGETSPEETKKKLGYIS